MLSLRFSLCVLALVCAAGCQTPERREALRRMDLIQAENSAVKARVEAESAQSKLNSARQRQEDLRVIETLNQKVAELTARLDTVEKGGERVAPKQPEPAKPDPKLVEELERVRREAREQMARMEEDLAKAQAQAEAAKLAAQAAEKKPQEQRKDLVGQKLPLVKFVDSSGKLVDLSQYEGKKKVVLVVMKGFYSQGICVYCTRQTADLAKNSKAFSDAGAEILVVYPGREDQINAFVKSVREYEKSDDPRFQLPFKVLLDVNQDVVRTLNIAGDLAHPTTFILDDKGIVRYQYVGRTLSDRPTAQNLLDAVKKAGEATP
ncbi:MAG TPA: redoxin domain-containing protein [Planctomycetota bacterium]|nr:redoxin domain-containing protein [Planctomycetota bacterium]